jgi:hypothetical protein
MFEAYEKQADQSGLSRMEILDMLKAGKINADDAAELLKEAGR